ncbi:hypothetical protein B0H12DRAFT_1121380 [Mycena haematopus]|nr:hypothetical protein B0H12DRAFT_1121380 [Mycena haematopus]
MYELPSRQRKLKLRSLSPVLVSVESRFGFGFPNPSLLPSFRHDDDCTSASNAWRKTPQRLIVVLSRTCFDSRCLVSCVLSSLLCGVATASDGASNPTQFQLDSSSNSGSGSSSKCNPVTVPPNGTLLTPRHGM